LLLYEESGKRIKNRKKNRDHYLSAAKDIARKSNNLSLYDIPDFLNNYQSAK